VAVKVGSIIIDIAADTQKLVAGMNKAQKSVKSSVAIMKKTLGGLAIGAALVKGFNEVTSAGFSFNSAMEQSTNGIASLITATSKLTDSEGNLLTQQELMNLAQSESIAIVDKLNKVNAETPHTLDQTNQIFKAILPGMRSLNVGYEDMIDITKQLSIASGAAGIGFQQLLAGADGLATGMVMPNSELGRFLSTLGITNTALKDTDDIVGLLTKGLSGFKAFDTMETSVSNISVAWSGLTGELTKGAFEASKEVIKDTASWLESATHWMHQFNIQVRDIDDIRKSDTLDTQKEQLEIAKEELKVLEEGVAWWRNQVTWASELNNKKWQILKLQESINEKEEATAKTVAKKIESEAQLKAAKAATLKATKDAEALRKKEIKDAEKLFSIIQAQTDITNELIDNTHKVIKSYGSMADSPFVKFEDDIALLNLALEKNIITQVEYNDAVEEMGDAYIEASKDSETALTKIEKDVDTLSKNISGQLESAMTSTFRSWLDDAEDWKGALIGLIKDVAAEMFRVLVIKQAISGVTDYFGIAGYANGGAFSGGSEIQAFASGGVVNTPTLFPMAGSKTGLMGEAGPEAIMPLTRVGGDLGVKVEQSPVNVTVQNYGSDEVQVQQDGNDINILIQQIEKGIASNMVRGISPVGSAMTTMRNTGRI